MSTTTSSYHPFNDTGQIHVDARGRRLRVCGTCGRVKLGLSHRALPAPDQREAPGAPLPDPWQVEMLHHAVELVLALPVDAVGWRLRLRVLDVSRAFEEGRGDAPLRRDPAVDAPLPVRGAKPRRTTLPSRRASSKKLLGGLSGDWRELALRAIDEGWTVTRTGTGHLRFEYMNHTPIVIPSTSGGRRGYQNARAAFKRAGLNMEGL